jgi:hypothetical protein
MKKKITDRQIRKFFWEADELPLDNKAAYLLGDLIRYGVSRCIQISSAPKSVYYEFDIYREGDFIITLVIDLPIDFTDRKGWVDRFKRRENLSKMEKEDKADLPL